uniref:Uncharacterized protein n=1 Tax=Catagonus wagneri TaxID=51154 RepID=A0A8C3X9N7_9CETA
MKVLQARKKKTSTELIIEPERPSSDKSGVSFSGFVNEPLDFDDESDVISALNYILPYFSEGNLEDAESTLLPFIQLLFSNVAETAIPPGHSKTHTGSPSLKPESRVSADNKVRQLRFLETLIDEEIQQKINEIIKNEKTSMVIHSNIFSPKLRRQILRKKLENSQLQEKSHKETESIEKRPLKTSGVPMGPGDLSTRQLREIKRHNSWRKENAQPFVENTLKRAKISGPTRKELVGLHGVQRPRELVRKELLSLFNKVSSFHPEAPAKVRKKSKDLSYMYILEDANARVKNMKASKTISYPRKVYSFRKSHSPLVHRTPEPKKKQEFTGQSSSYRLLLALRPLSSAVRSLINSASQEASSPLGEPTSQKKVSPESFSPSEPSAGNVISEDNTPQVVIEELTAPGKTALSGTTPGTAAQSTLPTEYSTTA